MSHVLALSLNLAQSVDQRDTPKEYARRPALQLFKPRDPASCERCDLGSAKRGQALPASDECESDSVTLSPPRAADGELAAATGGSGNNVAAGSLHNSLGVRENVHDRIALVADDVHEETVGGLHQFLEFMHMLLLGRIGIQKVHLHCVL